MSYVISVVINLVVPISAGVCRIEVTLLEMVDYFHSCYYQALHCLNGMAANPRNWWHSVRMGSLNASRTYLRGNIWDKYVDGNSWLSDNWAWGNFWDLASTKE